jgi:hypothetical protein
MSHFRVGRPAAAILTAVLLVSATSFAFESPLSPEAVREAYFLGQHRDEGMARFLDKYAKHLPPPKTGPYISSITFLTPFALLVQDSSRRSDYSSQQAALDHRRQQESVKVAVEILLTKSYSAFIAPRADSEPGSPAGYQLRHRSFWRGFDVQVFDEDKPLIPIHSSGHPRYSCGRSGCALIGAIIELEFTPEVFSSDSASVQVDPPEGDEVCVDFDLAPLR